MEFLAGSVRQPVTKGGPGSGAQPGHKFRGNQHTGGIPENAPSRLEAGRMRIAAKQSLFEALEEARVLTQNTAAYRLDRHRVKGVKLAAVGPDTVLLPTQMQYYDESGIARVKEAAEVAEGLLKTIQDSTALVGFGDPLQRQSIAINKDNLVKFIKQAENISLGSKMLADNIDTELLLKPVPEGKMTGWADVVAANPDGGAGFIEALRLLDHGSGQLVVATGELISAHIRRGTDPAGVRLSQEVARYDFTKPEAVQVESPIPYEEFNDPLLDLLPPESQRGIGQVMVALHGTELKYGGRDDPWYEGPAWKPNSTTRKLQGPSSIP